MTDEYDFKNYIGTFKLGEMVMINPEVNSNDSLRKYVNDQNPCLELIEVLREPTDPTKMSVGSGLVKLKAWNDETTDRLGWAITKAPTERNCIICTSSCRKGEPCAFFYSVIEGIE